MPGGDICTELGQASVRDAGAAGYRGQVDVTFTTFGARAATSMCFMLLALSSFYLLALLQSYNILVLIDFNISIACVSAELVGEYDAGQNSTVRFPAELSSRFSAVGCVTTLAFSWNKYPQKRTWGDLDNGQPAACARTVGIKLRANEQPGANLNISNLTVCCTLHFKTHSANKFCRSHC